MNPIDGQKDFIAVARVRNAPLTIAVTRPQAVALQPWRDETIGVGLRTLILILLAGLTLVGLLRQIRRVAASERALRESEERYALAMEGANDGHWDWEVAADRMFLSPKMKLLYGQSADARSPRAAPGSRTSSFIPTTGRASKLPSRITSREPRPAISANIASVNLTAGGVGCSRVAVFCAIRPAGRGS